MLCTREGVEEGKRRVVYFQGETYYVKEHLGKAFLLAGWALMVKRGNDSNNGNVLEIFSK